MRISTSSSNVVFCAASAYMAYGAIQYRPQLSFYGLVVLLAGLPFYFVPKKRPRPRVESIALPELQGQRAVGGKAI